MPNAQASALVTRAVNRRTFLRSAVTAFAPQLRARPTLPSGVAAGDVTAGRAIIWARADRPSRMLVEYATTGSFTDARRIAGPAAAAGTDFTARVDLTGLPANQRIAYRVRFQDRSDPRAVSAPVEGSFRTPPDSRSPRDVTFAFSADCVGQGWGIDPARGGLALYDTMRRAEPDVFIHLGDTIYADQPLQSEVKLDDGTIWRNVVTPEKSKAAATLDDFRGNYRYTLLDEQVRRFNAEVPQVVLWDDHEVRNNWYPSRDGRLAAPAKRAFFEYQPVRLHPSDPRRLYRSWRYGPLVEIFALDMRSHRGANSPNRQPAAGGATALLGARQVAWLKRALAASPALWKVVASDLPIGLVVRDGGTDFEAVANAEAGGPLGRELEIAGLLTFIRDRRIRNVLWITGDVHYCAAHHYDPSRARFTAFDPFWEFVAGPLHAGTFGPNPLDATFGPELRFIGIPPGMKPNRPPSDGLQFFGLGRIDHRTRALTVSLHNVTGEAIFTVELPPYASDSPLGTRTPQLVSTRVTLPSCPR
jgi:alkaline phosphatase D